MDILSDPHIAICECRICQPDHQVLEPKQLELDDHSHDHPELGPRFPSIEDLEHRENELAIDHPE